MSPARWPLPLLAACALLTAQARAQAPSALPPEAEPLPAEPDTLPPLEDAALSGDFKSEITQPQLEQLLRRYDHEPKVAQVVDAALRAAKHDPARYAKLAERARLRGLLPHIDLGARRGQGIDLRWTQTEDLEARRTTADDVTLFATVRFDLDKLMFAGEEVSLAREARGARSAEHQLMRAVVRVYFLRRRLMLERDLRGSSSVAQLLRIQEAEALLDAFTDGAWQRMLEASKRKAWKTGASTNVSARQSPPRSSSTQKSTREPPATSR